MTQPAYQRENGDTIAPITPTTSGLTPKKTITDLRHLLFSLPWQSQKNANWRYLPIILIIAFVLRAAISLAGDFTLHPDEIMQYLEPAHAIVFGNGILHWEYYYGGRSQLVIYFIAAVLKMCQLTGLDSPVFYIAAVKLAFCLLSLLIPYGLYISGRNLFDERTGRIALLLGAFWYELVGFAHKPMTEFIATALLFAVLVLIIRRPKPPTPPNRIYFAVFLAVLLVAIRFHYAPAVAFVLLAAFVCVDDKRIRIGMIITSIIAVFLVGVFEYATVGGFFYAYITNIKMNAFLDGSRANTSSPWIFTIWLTITSGGAFLLALIAGMRNFRQCLFILGLILLVVLPHMTQEHLEYRFIFAAIPLWLLLFARLLTAKPTARRWRQTVGIACAGVISLFGITNNLPFQKSVYIALSNETGRVNFIFDQEPIFAAYRQLAADPSVVGVYDSKYPYITSPGYYYLHKKIPFYSLAPALLTSSNIHQHASHLIASKGYKFKGLHKIPVGINSDSSEETVNIIALAATPYDEEYIIRLPTIIHTTQNNALTHIDKNGRQTPLENFVLYTDFREISIWKKAGEPQPIRRWKNYKVYPDSVEAHSRITKIYGAEAVKDINNYGVNYVDE